MFSFAAVLNAPSSDELSRRLRCATKALTEIPPHTGGVRATQTCLEDARVGWVSIEPAASQLHPRIHSHVGQGLAALVFGRVSLPAQHEAQPAGVAGFVAHTYERGGIEAVRRLDGSFCALLVERLSGRSVWCTDLIGHMSAHWLCQGGTTFLASHDVGLVALSGVTPELDAASALSVGVFDWSLQGRPLLVGANPTSQLCWYEATRDGVKQHDAAQLIRGQARAFVGATAAGVAPSKARETLDAMLQHLVDETSQVCAGAERVTVSLTAGIDSRLLLALTLAALPKAKLRAITSGTPWSLDVATAQLLCRLVGLPHERQDIESPDVAGFERRAGMYAFHLNGDTSSKRALASRVPPLSEVRLTGGAGEIYRGYYYGALRKDTTASARDVSERLWAKSLQKRNAVVAAAADGLASRVRARLEETLSAYEPAAASPHDLVDYFYLYERYGRWGALVNRRVWFNAYSPLACPSAIREAFTLVDPVGRNCPIHRVGAKRHLPAAAYAVPVNGTSLLSLSESALARPLARAGGLLDKGLQRLDARLSPTQSLGSVFAKSLYEVTHGLCTRSGSVARRVFTPNGLAALLGEHHERGAHLEAVSCLLTMELWLDQVTAAQQLSRSSS